MARAIEIKNKLQTKKIEEINQLMKIINAATPGEAWKKAVNLVVSQGEAVEDDGEKLQEMINVSVEIAKPTEVDQIVKKHGDMKMLEWMHNNFHSQKPIEGWGYCYGQRLKDFEGVNQYERVITKLKKNLETKSATLNFTFPPGDKQHMPCVNILDLKFRDGKLNGSAFMRSQDAGKKLYADIISMGEIIDEIAQEIGKEPGSLLIHIASLHIYDKDLKNLQGIVESKT